MRVCSALCCMVKNSNAHKARTVDTWAIWKVHIKYTQIDYFRQNGLILRKLKSKAKTDVIQKRLNVP